MKSILKKSLSIFFCLTIVFTTYTSIYAENTDVTTGIFDTVVTNSTYNFSEGSDIVLPFFRFAYDRIVIDKEINKTGIIFSNKSIDVNNVLKGMQCIFSNDTLRINQNVENVIAYANTTVISSNVDKSVYLIGKTLTIDEGVTIGEDVIFIGDKLVINGNVNGNVLGHANEIEINGVISKDLRINTNSFKTTDNTVISGEIYVETNNENLKIDDKFENAKLVVISNEEKSNVSDIIINACITCLVFALLYLLVNKISNKKLPEIMVEKFKKNTPYTVLMGALNLVLIPIVFLLLMILSITRLYIISVPLMTIYLAYIVVTTMLSTFIVGTMMYKYISEKYKKVFDKKGFDFIGAFVTYLSLYILCRLPYIGAYVTIFVVMLSVGIVFTLMTKKTKNDKDIEVIKAEDVK